MKDVNIDDMNIGLFAIYTREKIRERIKARLSEHLMAVNGTISIVCAHIGKHFF